ncbi:exodeoxyribonuclease III [Secundilactobacillus oryzae]|uniref:exodeoxyribonuclease III n=1 Tax=Secundilactobacillus oryzae TaxID=1202668 RepID=UPI00055804A1|nr:exodeoxyribonuclease III [Secundilactobacillus oryzae]
MKFISWNVNGLRAVVNKDFQSEFKQLDADFFCIQETKMQAGQLELDLPGYHQYYNYAERKGYSGTAIFTKHEPISVHYGIDQPELDTEGRAITLEYQSFYLLTCYTPNSGHELKRLDFRMKWDEAFQAYVGQLNQQKPVIICGDLNVAHHEIDLKNPTANHHNAGFTDEERADFTALLDSGLIDTYRYFYPDKKEKYTWWSYRTKARDVNSGWRIDYFLTSKKLTSKISDANILSTTMGSDHCPVVLLMHNLEL